jgi:hypothetical protein
MRRSGFNIVRLPVAWSSLEPQRGRIDDVYLEHIVETVRLLNRHRLYVVLDLHMTLAWGPRFGGAGAPRWAAVPLVPHVTAGEAGDWLEAVSPAVLAANSYFWLQPDWQADVLLVWSVLASRFQDTSGVVGYDLFNEPGAAPLPPGLFEERWLWPFYARTHDVIRRIDAHHLLFVEPPLVFALPPRIPPMDAQALVYSPHVYTGSLAPPAFVDDPDRLVSRVHEQVGEAHRLSGAAAWWGELGVDNGKPFAAIWADTALDALDDVDAGWAWWQWRQDWGWGVRNHAGDFTNTDFLRHLARPFLAAAPAGVHAGRGDGLRGDLRLTVDAVHANQSAIVAWPGATLGTPRVSGDCVAEWDWAPALGEVRIFLTERGACLVHLTAG